jgi:hypothetical protein
MKIHAKSFFVFFGVLFLVFSTASAAHAAYMPHADKAVLQAIITPSYYPLAPCPTCVDPSQPPVGGVTNVPSGTVVNPSGAITNPSPSTDPCETGSASIATNGKSKHWHHGGGISGFMEAIIKFFIELINLILKLLGGSPIQVPSDGNPLPTNNPESPGEPSTPANPTTPPVNQNPNPEPCAPTEGPIAPTTDQVSQTPSTPPVITTAPNPTTGTAGKPSAFWIHWNSTPASDAMLSTEGKRRSVVLLNAWEGDLIPKLKAANPSILVFAYKDLTSTRSYACNGGVDDASIPTGVGYCDADKNHPDWFMQSPGGGRFEYSGYAGHWQMDVGNPAYQQAWINNVKTELTAKKFDGVIMDNALFACDDYHGGTCPTKYPNDDVFQAAYVSMLTNAKTQLNAAGLKTMANLNGARTHAGIWKKYMAQLDGGFDEFWMAFSSSDMLPAGGSEGWEAVMEEITSNEAQGKLTLVQPHFDPGDTKAFRYTFASYLMANGGHASYSEISQRDGYGDPPVYHPEFDWNLGAANGAYVSAGANTFKREFKCGAVVVNANGSGNTTVDLGKSYIDESGATVTSVSLPSKSGSILRIANCTP